MNNQMIEEHYKANFNKIVKGISRMVGSVSDAEDIVQNAYERALRYDIRPLTNFDGWFYIVCKNCARDFMRDNRMQPEVEFDEFDFPSSTHRVSIPHLKMSIAKMLEKKGETARDIISLMAFRGLSPKEIYQLTSYSAHTIRQTLYRFRLQLRELYERKK